MIKTDVIIPCGGSGSRTGLPFSKLLYPADGFPLIKKTFDAFDLPFVSEIIAAVPREAEADFRAAAEFSGADVKFCIGGETRSESVRRALGMCKAEYVLIHDGARPFVDRATIERGLAACEKYGNAVACVPVTDSMRMLTPAGSEAVDRNSLRAVQTPQIFRTEDLKRAFLLAGEDGFSATDEASLYEKYIGRVFLFDGSPSNVKITYASDLSALSGGCRVGVGWDTHRLVPGRRLIIGGADIPHEKGLLGHSDADVLAHAAADALLGAAGKRDIGCLFPDDDPAYEGADSIRLLARVAELLKKDGYTARNVSAVVMAQKPKLKGYIPAMVSNIAAALGIEPGGVNIAATTTEKLGTIGEEKGMSAIAFCAIEKTPHSPGALS